MKEKKTWNIIFNKLVKNLQDANKYIPLFENASCLDTFSQLISRNFHPKNNNKKTKLIFFFI
jgi:hypothetical protein